MDPDEVVGEQFRVYRATAGYIRCDHPDGAEVTGQDAREVLSAIASLAHGPSTPVLVDLRVTHSVSREARRTFASSTVPSRIAMFVQAPVSRVIANFFIGVAGPSVPTRVFTDVDDAQRWLLDER
jgi:hypothetical protein